VIVSPGTNLFAAFAVARIGVVVSDICTEDRGRGASSTRDRLYERPCRCDAFGGCV
jgi:hypothetical protein